MQKEFQFLKDNILKNGYSLILTLYDCDLPLVKEFKLNNLKQEICINDLFAIDVIKDNFISFFLKINF